MSMIPLCDEIVVVDKESTDGTLDMLHALQKQHPKIRVIESKWDDPKADPTWFVRWINEARSHVKAPMMLQLDADEILGNEYSTISAINVAVAKRDAIAMNRLNFVRDARSLIPEGECCGKYVVRVGPSDIPWVSDEPHKRGEIKLLDMAHIEPDAFIYHMGFLRPRDGFFKKSRTVLGAFFGNYDERLARAEASGGHIFEEFPWWKRLDRYTGSFPPLVRGWLTYHGYQL